MEFVLGNGNAAVCGEDLAQGRVTPSHSKHKNEIPQELIDGDLNIPNGKFVSFTNKFKYLGTYLSQNLSDDTDIELRIIAATKNFNALGRTIFRNRKIKPELRCQNVHGHNCEHSPLGMRYMGTHEEPACQWVAILLSSNILHF